MKRQKFTLVVLIPCYNEEKTLLQVIRAIPKHIPGIGKIMVLVVNDGSTDKSEQRARSLHAHVLNHRQNRGLGVAFQNGLAKALELGADIIVNIDADMQFNPKDIPTLIAPVAEGRADMNTGSRFLNPHWIPTTMPNARIIGNRMFTTLVNILTGSHFTDTQCGFRAYSREAALNLNVISQFTYTQEVFIALVFKGMKITEVPIRVRYFKGRKAKISASLAHYGLQGIMIIMRTFRDYKPLVFFGLPGTILFSVGSLMVAYSGLFWAITHRTTPVRMVFWVGSFITIMGFLLLIFALLADMFKRIKRNQEEILYRLKTRY
jgi:glycosyltransferase involved in cell wall biosynthesis